MTDEPVHFVPFDAIATAVAPDGKAMVLFRVALDGKEPVVGFSMTPDEARTLSGWLLDVAAKSEVPRQ